MEPRLDKKIIAVYGPTISEKTGLAVNLAKYIWGKYNLEVELISADSRKVYKELTVVPVAVYPPYDRKIKVHMFRIVDSLNKPFTLYDYKTKTVKIIDAIHKRRRLPLIYGGGAVWMSSILENWNVPKDWRGDINYKEKSGRQPSTYQYIILIPEIGKPALFRKIEAHTERNIKRGILSELKKLAKNYNIDPLSPPTENVLYKSLEYRQFLEYCYENQKKLEDLDKNDIEKIQKRAVKALKDFARRQLSWIPKMEGKKHFVKSWKEARTIVDEFLLK